MNVFSLESFTMGQPVKGLSSLSPATLNRLVPGIGTAEAAGMLIQLEYNRSTNSCRSFTLR